MSTDDTAGGNGAVPACVDRWTCPYPGCGVAGQTQRGHERETDLAAHQHVVHPEAGETP